MAAIFIDGAHATPHNGFILITGSSAGEEVRLILTPHAAFALEMRLRLANRQGEDERSACKLIPFKPNKRRARP